MAYDEPSQERIRGARAGRGCGSRERERTAFERAERDQRRTGESDHHLGAAFASDRMAMLTAVDDHRGHHR